MLFMSTIIYNDIEILIYVIYVNNNDVFIVNIDIDIYKEYFNSQK